MRGRGRMVGRRLAAVAISALRTVRMARVALTTWIVSTALALSVAPAASAGVAGPQSAGPYTRTELRRVPISLTFTGRSVFLFGQTPEGCDNVAVVMEGPSAGSVRLMQKGRRVIFWLGVRQYTLTHVPGLYLVNLHCPECNSLALCAHGDALAALNRALSAVGDTLGQATLMRRSHLEVRDGELEPGEEETVFRGFWELQRGRGLYGVRENAIRIGSGGYFYHVMKFPTAAPEGKYHLRTFFLREGKLVGESEDEIFLRKSGLVGWLSRMAERRAATYGIFTVVIAIAAGVLAGSLFRRSAKH